MSLVMRVDQAATFNRVTRPKARPALTWLKMRGCVINGPDHPLAKSV